MKGSAKAEEKRIIAIASRSRQLLFSGGSYITLVLTLVMCAPPAVLTYMLAALISEFTMPWVPYAVMAALGFFIFLPMAVGAVRVAVAIYCGGDNPISELFFAFSSYGTYLRVLCLTLIQALKLAVSLGIPVAAFNMLCRVLPKLLNGRAEVLAALISAVLFVLIELIMSPLRGSLFCALADGDVRPIKGLVSAVKSRRRSLRESFVRLTLVILILVSALPLGIPLLLYTAPYLLVRYVYSAAKRVAGEIQTAVADGETASADNQEITETGDIKNEQH